MRLPGLLASSSRSPCGAARPPRPPAQSSQIEPTPPDEARTRAGSGPRHDHRRLLEPIDSLQGDIAVLQPRQARSRPTSTPSAPSSPGSRPSCARSGPASSAARASSPRRRTRRRRLVEIYKADEPDVVTVVLEADGFADLLTRAEFIERVGEQDGRIIGRSAPRRPSPSRPRPSSAASRRASGRVTAEIDRRPRRGLGGPGPARRDAATASHRRGEEAGGAGRRPCHRHGLQGDLAALEKEQKKSQDPGRAQPGRASRPARAARARVA